MYIQDLEASFFFIVRSISVYDVFENLFDTQTCSLVSVQNRSIFELIAGSKGNLQVSVACDVHFSMTLGIEYIPDQRASATVRSICL